MTHERAVRAACDELDARFETDYGEMDIEVEDVEVRSGEAAEQEMKDYAHIDWSALEQHVRKPRTETE
jgi:hypothetical protein